MDIPTVIFLDWDDTILASSHLGHLGVNLHTKIPAEIVPLLKSLEDSAMTLLTLLVQSGTLVIITNSESGWVEMSARKYLPGLVKFLETIDIVSARSSYEKLYPSAPLQWKIASMQDRLSQFSYSLGKKLNVISIGDSNLEREALMLVNTKPSLTKAVKMAERPSLSQLRREIDLLVGSFQQVLVHPEDLDLSIMAKNPKKAVNSKAAVPGKNLENVVINAIQADEIMI